jgi:hypothetical protein
MAEPQVIKKITIKKESLPSFQFTKTFNSEAERLEIDELYYKFRYRIISEDKNRTSFWSPIEKVRVEDLKSPFPYLTTNRISITKSGNPDSELITCVWSHPGDSESPSEYEKIQNNLSQYDVWIRWNNNNVTDLEDIGWTDWEFEATVSSTSFSIIKKDAEVKRVEFAIQISTTEKFRDFNNNKITLFRALSGTI